MSDKELDHKTQENNEVTEEFHLGGNEASTEEFHLGGNEASAEEFHLGGNEASTEELHDSAHNACDNEIDYMVSEDGNSIIIDADDPAMDVVQGFVRKKLESYGCERKIMMQIRLAVEEIFINIISYAYRPDVGKAEVLCEVKEDPMCVIIQFMDSGKPFDPLAYDEVDTSGQMFLERVGGFGIHLVKNTMDAVTYEYKDGKNILRIRKNF